jgi:hypothetical protein
VARRSGVRRFIVTFDTGGAHRRHISMGGRWLGFQSCRPRSVGWHGALDCDDLWSLSVPVALTAAISHWVARCWFTRVSTHSDGWHYRRPPECDDLSSLSTPVWLTAAISRWVARSPTARCWFARVWMEFRWMALWLSTADTCDKRRLARVSGEAAARRPRKSHPVESG